MPLITYPATLPGPSASSFTPRDRLARSSLPGDAQAAARERDFLGLEELSFAYTAVEAATFDAWWRDTLYSGGLCFSASWPLPPAFDGSRVRKYAESPRWTHIVNGAWRVAVQCEVYGLSSAPRLPSAPFVWDEETSNGFAVSEAGLLASETSPSVATIESQLFGGGKRYIEVEFASGTDDIDLLIGLVADGLPGAFMLERGCAGDGFQNAGANTLSRGSHPAVVDAVEGTFLNFIGSPRIGLAIDFDARKLWFRNAGGYASGADPATGTSPTYSGWAAGYEWRVSARADNDDVQHQVWLHAGAESTYLYPVPAGFTAGGA